MCWHSFFHTAILSYCTESHKNRHWRFFIILPLKLPADFVFGDTCFKEVLFFVKVDGLGHPREWVFHIVLSGESDAAEAFVGDVLDVVAETIGVHTEDTFRENSGGIFVFEVNSLADEVDAALLEFLCPKLWLLFLDGIDEIDAKVHVL